MKKLAVLIDLDQLPVGDKTLSAKEIIGNESQERMGLIIPENKYEKLKTIANREKAPCYKVGKITNDEKFKIKSKKNNSSTNKLCRYQTFLEVLQKP